MTSTEPRIISTTDLKAAVNETQRVFQRGLENLREHGEALRKETEHVKELREQRDAAFAAYQRRIRTGELTSYDPAVMHHAR